MVKRGPIIVKVGGSLIDLPGLPTRLQSFLAGLGTLEIVLVPGGGGLAEVIRRLDRQHHLGEEACHWLALRAVSLNARILAALLPNSCVTADPADWPSLWQAGRIPILDGHDFAVADEGQPGCLPHSWEVTSDSLAARIAAVCNARLLILLKSTNLPPGTDWLEAGRQGYVDLHFAKALSPSLEVIFTNFR